MKDICNGSKEENIEEKHAEEDSEKKIFSDVVPGDVIWVKLNKTSWWPAQVFDEDSMVGSHNSSKKGASEVLVRLYGSYNFFYVDPIKSHSDFVCMLKENNGKYIDIMMETLSKDLACIKSDRSKRQRAETKGSGSHKVLTKTPTKGKNSNILLHQTADGGSRKRKQGMQMKLEDNGPNSEPTSRKMKIMQRLALVPPPGSPFRPKYLSIG